MASKYDIENKRELAKHAKGLGIAGVPNPETSSRSEWKAFTDRVEREKVTSATQTVTQKKAAEKYHKTPEGKNYVAKAQEAQKRNLESVRDLPPEVTRKIDKEVPVTQVPAAYSQDLLTQIRQASPFVTGPASGGRMDYTGGTQSAQEYADYVNTYPDLVNAWNEIKTNPNSEAARYWLPRMGVTDPSQISIDKFGMAHQAENARLASGTYVGRSGVMEDPAIRAAWAEGKGASGQRDPTSDYWKGKVLDPGEAEAEAVVTQPVTQPGIDPAILGAVGSGLLGPFTSGGRFPAGYGGYPVLSLGTPSGASYPAAAEAAEGYAGALGFNIGPEGGLVYRPWEARAWQQSGIDPNLWNAPFAGGGLLGGGYPGSGRPGTGVGGTGTTAGINVPGTGATTGTTTTTPTNPFAVDPTAWHAPYADIQSGFVFNPVLAAGGQDEFMQWTRWKHQQNQAANAAKWTDPDAVDQFAFENLKAGPLARAAADQARENAFLQGSAAVVPTSAAYVDPAAQFQARQSALAAEREAAAPAVVQPFVDPAAHFQAQQSALAAARAAAATRQKISAYTGAGQAQHEQGLAPGLLGTARSPHVTWT